MFKTSHLKITKIKIDIKITFEIGYVNNEEKKICHEKTFLE